MEASLERRSSLKREKGELFHSPPDKKSAMHNRFLNGAKLTKRGPSLAKDHASTS